ncbi:MAG: LysR family transcriptional regulator [Rheinheimera sp.]|nr:LysR family transcriptional regulator [Rheinheimera sp.]
MELYQLKIFVTVAKAGGVTKASEQLYLSQPAVSAQIKALEEELGLTLFERTVRGMSLTPHGVVMLGNAEQLLVHQRDMLDEARRLRGGISGRLRLGSNRGPSAVLLGKLLAQLSETAPELDVSLEFGSPTDIATALREGRLDAGFYTEFEQHALLYSAPVDSFGIQLAVSPQLLPAAFRAEPEPDWQWLALLPWISAPAGSCCGRAAETLFKQQQFRPAKLIQADQEHLIRALISGGVGIGLLHSPTAREAAAKGEVVLLGPVLQEVQLEFGCLQSRQQEPLMQLLMRLITGVAAA